MAALIVRTARGPVEVADSGGTGPVLLVLHGIPGDYRQGITLEEDLAPGARVLRVSRPGYGRTPLSSGRTFAQQSDLYAAALDALEVETCVVLGISGGGPSAYAFATRHPSRCAGLVLCCAVAAHVLQVPEGLRRLAAVPGLWRALAFAGRTVARVRPPAPALDMTPAEELLLDSPGVREAADRFLRDTPTWTRGGGLRNDCRQILGASEVPWPGGSVPTVVIHGDTDEVVPIASAHYYAAAVPGAELVTLEGFGHAVPLFARANLADLVRGLLEARAQG